MWSEKENVTPLRKASESLPDIVISNNKRANDREVKVSELVELLTSVTEVGVASGMTDLASASESILERLTGSRRPTNAERLSSRHLIVDEEMAAIMAEDIGCSEDVARDAFVGVSFNAVSTLASMVMDEADEALIRILESDKTDNEEVIAAANDSTDEKIARLMEEHSREDKLAGVSRYHVATRLLRNLARERGLGIYGSGSNG